MFDEAQLIEQLGIQDLTPEEQENVLDEYKIQLGGRLTEDLSDDQLAEFEDIIDGNQEVIDRWLAANKPDYRDSEAYQELAKGYDEDPEKVPADKVYAATLWIATYSPDFEEKMSAVVDQMKDHIDEYK